MYNDKIIIIYLTKIYLLYSILVSFIKLKPISTALKLIEGDYETYLNKIVAIRNNNKLYFIIIFYKYSNVIEIFDKSKIFSSDNNSIKMKEYSLIIFIINNIIIIIILKIKIVTNKREKLYLKDKSYKSIENKFFKNIKKIPDKKKDKFINNKYHIKFENRIFLTINNILFKFFIMINLFVQILSNKEIYSFKFSSFIILKINGTGNKYIFSPNFNSQLYPNEVYINGERQNNVNNNYDLNQTNNFIKLVWNNNINSCRQMFYGCSDINEIILSNFNSSQVIDIIQMFSNCSSLISIDFSNFNTSQITRMTYLFENCSSLISLNLSNFDTANLIDLSWIFKYCSKLVSLDLSNFITSKVKDMSQMFNGCSSLTILNLSNFDTSQVTEMNNLFQGCSGLTSLNLSNFNFSKVYYISDVFNGCINMEYINLKNYNEKLLTRYDRVFHNVPDNIVICLNKSNNISILLSQIPNKNCYNIDCSDNWKSKKKINELNNICINNCQKINIYENDELCYENCPNGITNLNYDLCTKSNNDNYYPLENDPLNIGKNYIICYKDIKGYYIDKNNSLYKKCYYTCETCEIKGDNINHNCLQCNNNYSFGIINNYKYYNCYENCTFYYYFDEDNLYHCTMNLSCPNEFPDLKKDKIECFKNNIKNIIKDILNIEKIENYDNNDKNEAEEIQYYDTILETIETCFTMDNYDTSDIDKGVDEVIEKDKITISLTTTDNQKNNIDNNNITRIDIGECENLLRNYYNKTNNESLYMIKRDISEEGMKTKKVDFDIYCKLNNSLEILNLSICEKSKISIYVPFIVTENIDKLNSSSGYYNDICYIATSDSGTDISLKDRKNEFIDDNKTVCQDDCNFSEYDYSTHKAKCSCKVKQSSSLSFADMKTNKMKLLENFKNIKNFANINILICYKILFSKLGIIHNIGFYILDVNIIFHIICIFIFYGNQLNIIKEKIKEIIITKGNLKKDKDKKENLKIKKINKTMKLKHKKITITKKKFNKMETSRKSKIINDTIPEDNTIRKMLNLKMKKAKNSKKIINIKEFNDDEINVLSYDLAFQYDKRTYCQYYISLLKTKHKFIFSFLYNKDYNSRIIKINLFFMHFTTNYTINGLFFNDDTMHKIYESKGSFDIEYQLPIIIYSSLISMILDTLLKLLALSNDEIVSFKHNKERKGINEKGKYLESKLNIKFVLYFIISFIKRKNLILYKFTKPNLFY